jgi:hypothetical protein
MGARVKSIDRGFEAMVRRAKNAKGLRAIAGVQGSEATAPHGEFGARNVDVMVYHEFGTSTVPERSVIRATMDRENKKYADLVERATGKILDGEAAERAAGRLAELMASDMRRTIDESIGLEPLASSTVLSRSRKRGRSGLQNLALGVAAAAGGGERPLLDTGQLKRSITGKVLK